MIKVKVTLGGRLYELDAPALWALQAEMLDAADEAPDNPPKDYFETVALRWVVRQMEYGNALGVRLVSS